MDKATRQPGMNSLQQQGRFDDFVQEFNTERPHEALAMKVSGRNLLGEFAILCRPARPTYPLHDRDALDTACSRICSACDGVILPSASRTWSRAARELRSVRFNSTPMWDNHTEEPTHENRRRHVLHHRIMQPADLGD